ncbi:MAG: helix-turn-helix transcriptional regulator [candidate division WOR-3 bacterium]|nr:helix-turn-helix transcriptional regulator [candidate division WOR-3 bacterium]
MRGLTTEEAKEYIKFILDWLRVKLEADVIDYLAQHYHNPLKIVVTIDKINELQKRLGSNLSLARLKTQLLCPLYQKIEESGKSQRQIALAAGISPTALNQVLKGTYQGDTQKIIQAVEKALLEA